MSDFQWTWQRIDLMDDGTIVLQSPVVYSDKEAQIDRKKLRAGYMDWTVISSRRNKALTMIATNTRTSMWAKGVIATFVIHEKRKVNDA